MLRSVTLIRQSPSELVVSSQGSASLTRPMGGGLAVKRLRVMLVICSDNQAVICMNSYMILPA